MKAYGKKKKFQETNSHRKNKDRYFKRRARSAAKKEVDIWSDSYAYAIDKYFSYVLSNVRHT